MSTALIGHTGFVGGTLCRQTSFDDLYNSKNIEDIRGKSYSLVVCAGARGTKWIANREPLADLANLKRLTDQLGHVQADKFLLISTIDVYPKPLHVDEAEPIDAEQLEPYGKHRFQLEQFVRERFGSHTIVRLPALFGEGLKKNFIFDLLHNNALDWTHCESVFQFYDLSRLWNDVSLAVGSGQPLINFATAPVQARELARRCFGVDFTNVPDKPPARYDMRSRFASVFGGEGPYLYSADEEFDRIVAFVAMERARLAKAGSVR